MPTYTRKRLALFCRPRQKKDDAFIVRVALQTMRRVYRESTGLPLTKSMILQQLRVNTTTMIVENGHQPIGYYSYTMLAPKRLYLSALVLSSNVQGKGIGQRIANHIEREARAQGAQIIHAHVQCTNSRAIVFWFKNGYRILYPQMKGMLAIGKTLQ